MCILGYPDALCRVNNCGGCQYEWYHGISGNVLQCSGCIDRYDIERGDGTSWSTSDCETCSCEVILRIILYVLNSSP
jgi:hypothetical protein